MTDIGLTIAPKSDQLNADDLLAGPLTIKITRVAANPESAEQPISIFFEGDGGKPYKACKSMRRVLVNVWGRDGTKYPGRSMTLYRDDKVQFGGLAVGGIRISHMSHIDKERGNRKPFTVKPLKPGADAPVPMAGGRKVSDWLAHQSALFEACETDDAVDLLMDSSGIGTVRPYLRGAALEQFDAMVVRARARIALSRPSPDGSGSSVTEKAQGPSVTATGDEIPF